jgi:hypothetical protein
MMMIMKWNIGTGVLWRIYTAFVAWHDGDLIGKSTVVARCLDDGTAAS